MEVFLLQFCEKDEDYGICNKESKFYTNLEDRQLWSLFFIWFLSQKLV